MLGPRSGGGIQRPTRQGILIRMLEPINVERAIWLSFNREKAEQSSLVNVGVGMVGKNMVLSPQNLHSLL